MKIGIIILVTRPKALMNCLDKLTHQTYNHKEFEIILVLSEDCHINLPQTDIKITCLIENNLHLSLRRNKGVRQTRAELIAFLDDDVIPPHNWIECAINNLDNIGCDGACGPIVHFDKEASLSYQLSGAATDSFFLEGFEDTWADKVKKISFYNMPGCNCVIKRNMWEVVGGFNETMYHYMDDIEFFYIASHLGFSFYVIPQLAVEHKVEPFPLPFLKKKMITRFHTGINTILFYEIFWKMPFIRIAVMGHVLIIGSCFFYPYIHILLSVLLSLYLLVSLMYALKFFRKNFSIFLLLPLAFIATHATNFLSFTGGILFALGNRRKFQPVIAGKIERFQKCQN